MKCLLYFLLSLFLLFSCSTDDGGRVIAPSPSPSDGGMTFVLHLPDPATGPASYALTDAEENAIETLDVFAFKKELLGSYILKEYAEVEASSITTDALNPRKKSFRVNFFELKENLDYVFVIIANGRDLLGTPSTYIGNERDAILSGFKVTNIGRWIDTGRSIPMWGETKEVKLTNNMKLTGVKLLRMLSKIDVHVSSSAEMDFSLTSVRLYNYRKNGYVVPSRGNFTSNTMETVKAPTLCGGREEYPSCVLYSGTKDLTSTGCVSQIYTFETDVALTSANTPDFDRMPCVVIGGRFQGGPETYYRINFVKKENGVTTYLNLLRNHRYTLNIQHVHGGGYLTPEAAFRAKGMNLDAEVLEWNDSKMTELVFDGQYVLTVSRGEWSFMKEARTASSSDNLLEVYTDVPTGWETDKVTDASSQPIDWLSLSPSVGPKDKTVQTRLLLKENTTGNPRTGYVYLKAGRLMYRLEVNQSHIGFVPVSAITLDKTDITVKEGESFTLNATVLPANATDKTLTWESDDMQVATVTQEGKIYAHKPGTALVRVKATDGSGTESICKVTVLTSQVFVTGVTLDKNTASMTTGTPLQLNATVLPVDATNKKVTWESSDPTVASVDATGLVSVYKTGTARITVVTDDGGKTAVCQITARSVVTGVTLNKDELTLVNGEVGTLKATVLPFDVTNKSVTWSSSDESVAVVNANGQITTRKAGTTVITVKTAEGGKTATCTVTVSAGVVSVTSITLNKTSTTLKEGSTEKLNATIAPASATNKEVMWTSDKPSVASVAVDGTITAHKSGTATITAKTVDGGKTAMCMVTVNTSAIAVTGVSLNPDKLSLVEGNSSPLTATILPGNATVKSVTWSSSAPAIASVDGTGRVTAHKAGQATITVTTTDGNKTGQCLVTVTSSLVAVTGVSLNKSALSLSASGSEKLQATITPSNATNKSVTWKSSDPFVASVAADGTVSAHKAGSATITVTSVDGGKEATCAVRVNAGVVSVTGVTLNKTQLNLVEGNSEGLTATVTPSDATNKNVTWSSSNSSVATVDATGKVTALSAGNATITVTTADGSKTAVCSVSVTAKTIAVTGISVSPTSLAKKTGESHQLSATVSPANATNKNVTWTSSNPAVATVSSTGLVTATGPGSATITVASQADPTKTATASISVTQPVTGVTISPTTSEVREGETLTLTATVSPGNASNKNVTWSSSNTAIATVDASGVVTGKSVGAVTITVTTVEGGKTAVSMVTVKPKIVSPYYPSAHKGWAGSNIYWDGSKLTFDDTDVTTHQNYQGVFFQWGSLWGIAPNDESASTTTVYTPSGQTTVSWTSIPRVDTGLNIPDDKPRSYLMEIHDPSKNIGDICRYLTEKAGGTLYGKKWRMPTQKEFESLYAYTPFGNFGVQSGNASGTTTISSGYKRDNIFLPASGARNEIRGSLGSVGELGLYWSASPYGNFGYHLNFSKSVVTVNIYAARAYGMAVRCVQE